MKGARLAWALIGGAGLLGGGCSVDPQTQTHQPALAQHQPDAGRIRGIVRLKSAAPAPAFERVPKDQEV